MKTWPEAQFIRIIKGTELEYPVDGAYACRTTGGGYVILDGPRNGYLVSPEHSRDSIDEWEEVTIVPASPLRALKKTWDGFGQYDPDTAMTIAEAMQVILSDVPDIELSPLEQAFAEVQGMPIGASMTENTIRPTRLGTLLAASARVQIANYKRDALVNLVRVCADWADLEDPERDALKDIHEAAKTDHRSGDCYTIPSLIGEVSAHIATHEPERARARLITIGRAALNWVAEIIEEGA